MAAEKETTSSPVWDSWVDSLKAAASPMSTYASWLEGWRKASGGADSPASGEPPERAASGDFMRTFLAGPQALLRMTELAAETMRSSAAAAGAEQAPHPLLSGLDVWTAAAAQYHRMAEPWTDLMQRSIGIAAALGGPSGAGDPLGDALERSFGVLADFPGINGELPALLREATANAVALASAREGYRVIIAATWQRAFEAITRELLRRTSDGKPVDSPAALLSLSTTVADRVFVETFNSARYIDAQQRLSSALADQRRNEAKVVDLLARLGHFPTRRDHDEALREIGELRREVRALKRAVRTFAGRPDSAVATAGQPPRSGAAAAADEAAVTGSAKRRTRAKPAQRRNDPPKQGDRGE